MHSTSHHRAARTIRSVTLLVLLPAMLALSGCFMFESDDLAVTTPPPPPVQPSVEDTAPVSDSGLEPKIDYFDAAELVADGARFINVDTKSEYDREHIAGTSNVPMRSLNDLMTTWARSDTIVITSSAESRARSAQAILAREGFNNSHYVAGGHDQWQGSFAGTDARVKTNPALIYYFYVSDTDNAPNLFGTVTAADLRTLRKETMGLEDQFPNDIEVVTVDLLTQRAETEALIKEYDLPTVTVSGWWDTVATLLRLFHVQPSGLTGQNKTLVAPSWLLVDRDGRTLYYDALPLDTTLPTLYSWCLEQER